MSFIKSRKHAVSTSARRLSLAGTTTATLLTSLALAQSAVAADSSPVT